MSFDNCSFFAFCNFFTLLDKFLTFLFSSCHGSLIRCSHTHLCCLWKWFKAQLITWLLSSLRWWFNRIKFCLKLPLSDFTSFHWTLSKVFSNFYHHLSFFGKLILDSHSTFLFQTLSLLHVKFVTSYFWQNCLNCLLSFKIYLKGCSSPTWKL